MTVDTLRFLLDLLCRQQVNVGSDDFEATVVAVVKAKVELLAALKEGGDKK